MNLFRMARDRADSIRAWRDSDEELLRLDAVEEDEILELMDREQKSISKEILQKLKHSRAGERTLFVIEGSQGTGKSFVGYYSILKAHSNKPRFVTSLLLQGQTLDKFKVIHRGGFLSTIAQSWDSKPFWLNSKVEKKYDLLVVDEGHLMFLFPGTETPSAIYGKNAKNHKARMEMLENEDSLLETIGNHVEKCLVLIYDPKQRVQGRHVTNAEFEKVFEKFQEKSWNVVKFNRLEQQYRSGSNWIDFANHLFTTSEIDLEEIAGRFSSFIDQKDNLFRDEKFHGSFIDDYGIADVVSSLELEEVEGSAKGRRVLAAFHWPDKKPWSLGVEGQGREDESKKIEFSWAKSNKRNISKWADLKSSYKLTPSDSKKNSIVSGVGYYKAISGDALEAALVLVSDRLKLVESETEGKYNWVFTSDSELAEKSRRTGKNAPQSVAEALNDVRMLLGRGIYGCHVYFEDYSTQQVLSSILPIHRGGIPVESNYE